jgi:hypothetical protein
VNLNSDKTIKQPWQKDSDVIVFGVVKGDFSFLLWMDIAMSRTAALISSLPFGLADKADHWITGWAGLTA